MTKYDAAWFDLFLLLEQVCFSNDWQYTSSDLVNQINTYWPKNMLKHLDKRNLWKSRTFKCHNSIFYSIDLLPSIVISSRSLIRESKPNQVIALTHSSGGKKNWKRTYLIVFLMSLYGLSPEVMKTASNTWEVLTLRSPIVIKRKYKTNSELRKNL